MKIVLWILQVLLAAAFFAHGWMMLMPPADLVAVMNASMPVWLRLLIGVAEVAGALGLILPGLTRIQPRLLVWAALGLTTIVVLATGLHLIRAEYSSALSTAILALLGGFVTYMRARVKPIAPRRDVTTDPTAAA